MPVYVQKSTIFFNIVMRIFIISIIIVISLMYFIKGMEYVPTGLLSGIPRIGLSLILNYKGKVSPSVFFVSVFSLFKGKTVY